MSSLFLPDPRQADKLAAHLPVGGVFDAARKENPDGTPGSNFRALIQGLGEELYRLEQILFQVYEEIDPRKTVLLIEEWERSVGIPGGCFTTTKSLEERRDQVLLLLRGLKLQTEQDYIDLAAIFGEVIEVEQGAIRGIYPMPYPTIYYADAKAARNTMIVHFPERGGTTYPLAYDFPYSVGTTGIVECLITHNRPAEVDVKFSYGTTKP